MEYTKKILPKTEKDKIDVSWCVNNSTYIIRQNNYATGSVGGAIETGVTTAVTLSDAGATLYDKLTEKN